MEIIEETKFYIKFLDYLTVKIFGLWYHVDEKTDLYSWGYIPQTINEKKIEKYDIKSIKEVAEDITKYLIVVDK